MNRNVRQLVEKAIQAQSRGNQRLALRLCQRTIKKYPNCRTAYILIDKVLRQLGRLEDANKYYDRIQKTFPEVWQEESHFGLRLGRVKDGLVIPLANKSAVGILQGGIKTARECPQYFHHFRQVFVAATDLNYLQKQNNQSNIKLHGTYLYVGFIFNHFGHYMAECTHRLWAYSKLSSQIDGVVALPQYQLQNRPYKHFPSFVQQAMTYMQIPPKKVNFLAQKTQVEHILVPEQASTLNNKLSLSKYYLDFLAEHEERFFFSYEAKISNYPEKIYVSRSHLIHYGGIAGETYIEKLLQKKGYFIFKPENYSLHEQMNYYRHAKLCIFSEGSAIHGLELLGWLSRVETAAIILRREENTVFDSIITSRTPNFCKFEGIKTTHPLANNNNNLKEKLKQAVALSIFADLDLMMEFFRDNNLASLDNFKLDHFYRQEAIDVSRYIMKTKLNQNNPEFLDYFAQFRHDFHEFSNNPYLR